MKRLIVLINKSSGNDTYACDGSGCDLCEIRFKCFTFGKGNIIVDWNLIKTKKSPTKLLKDATNSKIYAKGSKRFSVISKELI